MSKIITDFSGSPYWDDYNENKQFYRILFIPKRAVQTREVNQLQTMIQDQITRFGNHVFKDGSIVDGCNIMHIPQLPYVRFVNEWNSNGGAFDDNLNGMLVVSATTGVRAVIRLAKSGFVSQYPATNRFYVDYIKTGEDNGNEVNAFRTGETLTVYLQTQEKLANTLDSNKIYNTINVLTENIGSNIYSTGIAYGITVDDGVIYQKGYFVKNLSHTITVKDFDTDTTGMYVGFQTREAIVSYLQDQTLIDPVDTSNRNGIGANRLKLVPVLEARHKSTLTEEDDFFPLIEFNDRSPVTVRIDPEYANLGDYIAKRSYEGDGDFYVKPMLLSTEATANTATFNYLINSGVTYVKGNRVELINTKYLEAPRATDTGESNGLISTLNYGGYVLVNEFVGTFNFNQAVSVNIYDTAQKSITDREGSDTGASGNVRGTAKVRMVSYNSGTKGSATATYRVYLSDIVMNSGYSFTDMKSIGTTTTYNAKADFVLEQGRAVIKESSNSSLIFDLGVGGIKRLRDSLGANDTQFYFRSTSTATLQSNGSVTFTTNSPHAGGSERLFATAGTVSTVNKLKIDVSLSGAAYSTARTGTVTVPASNTLVGTTTTFTTDYKVGDFVRVTNASDHQIRRIVAITDDTHMELDAAISGSNSSSQHRKYFMPGTVLNLEPATVVVNSNTQFTVSLGYSLDSGAPQTARASYPILRTEAVEIKKNVRKSHYVKIDATSDTLGPWNLGLTDVFKIEAVYVGATYSESNADRKSWFTLDTGQTATHYNQSSLVLKPQYKDKITSASRLLVKLSFFESNNTTGIGFFSVDSYPVRGPGVSANTTNVSYAEIPIFGNYNLRNSVDFRLQKGNSANVTTVIANATVNPAANNTYIISGSGSYLAEPDTNFQADTEYYLPRIDLIQINKDGIFNIKPSISSIKPVTPVEDGDSAAIGTAFVPPFPSLTVNEQNLYSKQQEKIETTLKGNRNYTKKDVYGLDQRITRLEYYQVLSMLEAQAKDYTILDENGLDRFKNGIFADPFNSHALGDVSNFEYNIAIDQRNSLARPKFKKTSIDLNVDTLSSTVAKNVLLSLPYTSELLISQPYASKIRNVTESVWNWSGNINIFPSYDYYRDEQSEPEVNITIDTASAWEQFANSPFGSMFGDWEVAGSTSTSRTATSQSRTGSSTTTTTTTSETLSRLVNELDIGSTSTSYDLGSFVSDISISPYMRSREIAFAVSGLKPNTIFNVFFDKKLVSPNCAPGIPSSSFNVNTGEVTVTEGKESQVITRTGDWGSVLRTDSNGNLYGLFLIPAETFRVGERELLIANVSSLDIGEDAILSSARAVYNASSMTVTKKSATINTIEPTINTRTTVESRVETSTITRTVTVPNISQRGDSTGRGGNGGAHDPLGQSFQTNLPVGIPGMFLDKIGVYFNSKDPTLGITCKLVEMLAGVPDTTHIVASSYLKPSEITTSNDSSAETVFKFNDIPYLTKDKYYAFFLVPDGDSPEYTIWLSEVGGQDILTNVKIFSNPYLGDAFKSSNSASWTVLSTEDIKFNLYRCKFSTSTGTANFVEDEREYITMNGFTLSNSAVVPQVGDVVYSQYANTVLNVSNGAPFGYVHSYDEAIDQLIIDDSTGGFEDNMVIEIHRPTQAGNVAAIGSGSKIASTTIQSLDNVDFSVLIPRLGVITPTGTTIDVAFKGTSLSENVDTNWISVQLETEREFNDNMRTIKSVSNRVLIDNSLTLRATLNTTSDYISPVIDLRRKNVFAVENLINDDVTNEDTRYGAAFSKYVSRQIVLADGQDAEDVKVYITGHRPPDTNIHCYIKFLNNEDSSDFYSKLWTKMDLTEGTNVYNNPLDTEDYSEYGYSVPTVEAQQGEAYLDANNNGIIAYRNANGSVFSGYKSFAIKLVFTSPRRESIPRARDVRSIALQI